MRSYPGKRATPAAVAVLACIAALCCPAQRLWAANTLPVACAASCTVEPGDSVAIMLEASDGDGDPLTFIITTLPAKGDLSDGPVVLASGDLPYTLAGGGQSVTFTADEDAHGTDTFQFKANDGTGDSPAATFSILINLAPVGVAATFFTEPNTDVTVTLPAEDPDGDTLTYAITTLPGHGRLKSASTTLTDTSLPFETSKADVTYSPDPAYHGQDTFTFTANDGNASSDAVTARIEVNTTPAPDDLTITVLPNGTAGIQLTSIDADKDPVRYLIVSLPAHGTLDVPAGAELPLLLAGGQATVVYTVEAEYRGTDSFHYRVQDAVSVSERAIVVIAVNTPPLSPGATLTGPRSGTLEGTLSPTDADGDTLTVRITRLPTGGTLTLDEKTVLNTTTVYAVSGSSLAFVYTPGDAAGSEDGFTWVANDGKQDSTPGEVVITLTDEAAGPADDTGSADPPPDPDEADGQDDAGEQVASEPPPPRTIPGTCGLLTTAQIVTMALMQLMVPRRFFHRNPATRRRLISYK